MRGENFLFIILSVLIPCLLLIRPIVEHKKSSGGFRSFFKIYRYDVFIAIVLAFGFFIRLYRISTAPAGFNQDEASLGYDAWSILNHGIDRNGIHMPVHLIAWGSGQNAFYAYLCMPFIRLFGLTEFSIRLPMAITGCISLLTMRKLLKTISSDKLTAVGVFLLAIMPWHIMKSRWGLESNIFPDLVLLASLLIILGTMGKRRYLYLGSTVLGLAAYSYGTSYFFIPVFLLVLFIYLIANKKIQFRHAFISIGIVAVVSLPIILFVLINQFDWNQITTPFFTIPRLNQARQASILNLEGNILAAIWTNVKNGMELLVVQKDSLPWNSLPFYGTHYVVSLPFTIIGVFAMFRKKGFKIDFLFFAWLLASLLMMAIITANINRLNIIYFPILYFTILGVYTVIDYIRFSRIPVISMYAVMAVLFIFTYFGNNQETISRYFFDGLGDAIEYAIESNEGEIHITNEINAPYIFALFYSQTDPHVYIDTVEKLNHKAAFEKISGFDNYEFSSFNKNKLEHGIVYIMGIDDKNTVRALYMDAEIEEFGQYIAVKID